MRAFIVKTSNIVSPLEEHLEHSELIRCMSVSASLHKLPEAVILDSRLLVGSHCKSIGLVQGAAEQGFRVQCITLNAFLKKIKSYSVIDVEQIVGVFPCILAHLLRQRSHAPICQLVLLVGKH